MKKIPKQLLIREKQVFWTQSKITLKFLPPITLCLLFTDSILLITRLSVKDR